MNGPVTVKRTFDVAVTVEEMADGFAMLASDEQAEFLRLVALRMDDWQAHKREMQQHWIGVELREAEGRDRVLAMLDNILYAARNR